MDGKKCTKHKKNLLLFLHRRWNQNEFLMYYISSLLFVFACIFFLPLTFNKRFTTWNLKFFSLHRVCMFIFISFLCSTSLLLLHFFSSFTLHFFSFTLLYTTLKHHFSALMWRPQKNSNIFSSSFLDVAHIFLLLLLLNTLNNAIRLMSSADCLAD